MDKKSKHESQTINVVEEYRENLEIRFANGFLNMAPKSQTTTKLDTLDDICVHQRTQ